MEVWDENERGARVREERAAVQGFSFVLLLALATGPGSAAISWGIAAYFPLHRQLRTAFRSATCPPVFALRRMRRRWFRRRDSKICAPQGTMSHKLFSALVASGRQRL